MEEEDDGYAEYDKSLETLGRVRAVCAVKSCHNPQGISQNTLITISIFYIIFFMDQLLFWCGG